MEKLLAPIFAAAALLISLAGGQIEAGDFPAYRSESNLVYCTVAGKDLRLNAFLPANAAAPAPAMVEIHGGWWFGGAAASQLEHIGRLPIFQRRGPAGFFLAQTPGGAG